MKKVNIIKDNIVVQFVKFEDEVQMQEWIDMLAVNHPWGKPAHTITTDVILVEAKEQITELIDEVEVVVQEYAPAVYETIDVPSEYEVEIVDISDEIAKDAIRKQIAELEASITPRRMREAIMSGDYSWIENVDLEIEILRGELK